MVHAIAKITNTSGLKGEVRLKPLSRYSIDYIMTKDLHIGQIENNLSSLKLESKVGDGKKMKFKFQGIDTHTEAKNIVGKIIYIDSEKDDNINFIGENVIGLSTHEYHDWKSSMLISYAKGARTWERHIDIEYEGKEWEGKSVSKYCSTVCFLFIAFKILFDPLWIGKCTNGINLLQFL